MSPISLTIQTRRWIDYAEVREIVNTMSADNKELLNAFDLTPAIQREISDGIATSDLIGMVRS